MPKGIPNKKKDEDVSHETMELEGQNGEEEKEVDDLVGVVSKMLAESESRLLEVISQLSERIENVAKQNVSQPTLNTDNKLGIGITKPVNDKCPQDIRDLVDQMISPECSVRVEDSKTSPTFTVHITLPPKLQTQENDVRSKTVSYSVGVNGIKEWLEKVQTNIWQEFKSRGQSVPR